MRIVTTLITILAVAAPTLARAQDVAPGAIGALGGSHRHHRRHHVRIQHLYHRHVRHVGIQLPPGTSRPGPSRSFIPAR